MAISSGRGRFVRFPKMDKAREFFDVKKPFWYTPLSDKNVLILIEATPCESIDGRNSFSQEECKAYCALYKWCAEEGNFDENGSNYIPCCSDYERKDKTNVFFKEIG